MAWRGSGVRIPLAPQVGISEQSGIPFFMRKRRNSNDFKAYDANRECTEKYTNVHEIGTQRGTRIGHPSRHSGTMRTKFGSVVYRADRGTFRAKYTYRGEVITRTFKDRLSAEAWLHGEKSRVEADKAGVT